MKLPKGFQHVDGSVVAPKGFRAAGVAAGIKSEEGASDVGLLMSDEVGAVAGVFTTNKVKAAPVQLSRHTIVRGTARGVVVNSGNANACTGDQGVLNAATMANQAAACCEVASKSFLVCSTGIIGEQLPMDKVLAGIESAARAMSSDTAAGEQFARAIMTTDLVPKAVAIRGQIRGAEVTIGGATKGSGMIAPRLATMLAFITTDASIAPDILQTSLSLAVKKSFNCITVDGHTSTNDTVIVLSNGLAGNEEIASEEAAAEFQAALDYVCTVLAQEIVRDGEGAERLVEVRVKGAESDADASAMAREIAESPLVKTAMHGGDPNWGRIVSAAGYAGVPFDPDKSTLRIGDMVAFQAGQPSDVPKDELALAVADEDILIRLKVGDGPGSAVFWTCDLSKQYIEINAEYHT